MNRNELLDYIQTLGLSSNGRLDLEQRNVNKKSLNEIIDLISNKNVNRESAILDKDDNWVKRTYYFSGFSHLMLLIYSPRLYVYKNAPINNWNLEDVLSDIKLYIDAAVDSYESFYAGIDFDLNNIVSDKTNKEKTVDNILTLLHDPVASRMLNLIPTFNFLPIDRSLVYKKQDEATIILKECWPSNPELDKKELQDEFYKKVAEGRDQFYFDISEWS